MSTITPQILSQNTAVPAITSNLISAAITLTQAIYQVSQAVKNNQQSCKDLAQRIVDITEVLQQLNQLPDNENFAKAMEQYAELLKKCSEFVNKFAKIDQKDTVSKFFVRIFKAYKFQKQFTSLNDDLSDMRAVLNLSLNVQGLWNRENDKQIIAELRGQLAEANQNIRALTVMIQELKNKEEPFRPSYQLHRSAAVTPNKQIIIHEAPRNTFTYVRRV